MAGAKLAEAFVELTVRTTKFARDLTAARGMFTRAVGAINVLGTKGIAGFTGMARAVGRVGSAARTMAVSLAASMGPLLGIAGAIGVLGGAGLAVATFAKFEQSMARVHAVTGATDSEFRKLTAAAEELGAKTVFSASQAAEAMGNFAVAGFSVNEIMAASGPALNLAAAGQLDMATASDITAKVMRGLGLDAEETQRAVDVLAKAFTTSNTDLQMLGDAFRYVGPVGKAAGKDMEELTAAIQIMSDAGIQGQSAGAALRNILLRLQSQPKPVRDALKNLGIEIGDSSGRMKHLSVILDEVSAAMADKTEMEKTAIAATLADTRAAAAFMELLDGGGDKLREYEKRLQGSAGWAQRIADIQLNTLQGSFTLLASAVEGAAIVFGRMMAPILRRVAESLTALAPILGRLSTTVRPVAEMIGQRMAASFQSLGGFLDRNMGEFVRWGELLAEIAGNVGRLMATLGTKIVEALGFAGAGAMADTFAQKVTAALDMISLATTNPLQALQIVFLTAREQATRFVAFMVEKLRSGFTIVVSTISALIQSSFQMISSMVSALVELVSDVAPQLVTISRPDIPDDVKNEARAAIASSQKTFAMRQERTTRQFFNSFEENLNASKNRVSQIGAGFLDAFVDNLEFAADEDARRREELIAAQHGERFANRVSPFTGAAIGGAFAFGNRLFSDPKGMLGSAAGAIGSADAAMREEMKRRVAAGAGAGMGAAKEMAVAASGVFSGLADKAKNMLGNVPGGEGLLKTGGALGAAARAGVAAIADTARGRGGFEEAAAGLPRGGGNLSSAVDHLASIQASLFNKDPAERAADAAEEEVKIQEKQIKPALDKIAMGIEKLTFGFGD